MNYIVYGDFLLPEIRAYDVILYFGHYALVAMLWSLCFGRYALVAELRSAYLTRINASYDELL